MPLDSHFVRMRDPTPVCAHAHMLQLRGESQRENPVSTEYRADIKVVRRKLLASSCFPSYIKICSAMYLDLDPKQKDPTRHS